MPSQFARTVAGYVLAVTCLAGTANAQIASRSSAVASPTYSSLLWRSRSISRRRRSGNNSVDIAPLPGG